MKSLKIFKDAGALLQGHFLLSSGLHSGQYLQCARVLGEPHLSEKLCQSLAKNFSSDSISAVVGPAMGGIILAYELSRLLDARALFTEREAGKMRLRRGFALSARDKVLVAEDVITTGGSVKEVVKLVQSYGAEVIAVCALVDRSRGKIDLGVKYVSLLRVEATTYAPEDCPLCKQGIKLVKPGSK